MTAQEAFRTRHLLMYETVYLGKHSSGHKPVFLATIMLYKAK